MPTQKQIAAAQKVSENIGSGKPEPIGKVLKDVGYSESVSKTPARVTDTTGFQELLEQYLPDDKLTQIHDSLLASKKLDHMVFPLGPKDEDDLNLSGSKPNAPNRVEKAGVPVERTTLTDQEIKAMLADVNCTVRRIVHGETARHVYFWAPDTGARQNALKLAYDIKGKAAPKEPPGDTYLTYIQQNNLNPNAPESKDLVDSTLTMLMSKTKRNT